tara:strand:- start:42 stop:707 length:666 start_codon:yes stop_codon:yes gene_type:complete
MRFVNINSRKFISIIFELPASFLEYYTQKIKHTKWNFHKWKGLTLMKDPMTLSVYMMMMQEIKPQTILEFGTYDGGSILWMSDIMKSLGHDCDIHTFDINENRVRIPKDSGIKFHKLDNYKIQQFISDNHNLFEQLKSPILMIEDSHENAAEVIRSLDPFLKAGDYLVIEDTLDQKKYNETIVSENGIDKMNYEIDTFYCDFWGMNNSWNVNSIFRKKGSR